MSQTPVSIDRRFSLAQCEYVCDGGNSGRSFNPGANGSVYFLTETQAPLTYTKLEDDIIFRVSPIGVPSLISDSYNGQLVETEDSYIYTLSVPNVREETDGKFLTIKKFVNGNSGDRTQEFTFTFTVDADDPPEGYEWMKNTVAQSTGLHSGDTFTLKHGDEVIIVVPTQVDLTVSEQNLDYTTYFKLDDGQTLASNTMTFSITDDATLEVVNSLGMVVPTGVMNNIVVPLLGALFIIAFAALILWQKKKYYSTNDL